MILSHAGTKHDSQCSLVVRARLKQRTPVRTEKDAIHAAITGSDQKIKNKKSLPNFIAPLLYFV